MVHVAFWCSVILGNSTAEVMKEIADAGFGAASFWVTAQRRGLPREPHPGFGAASFWVTAQPVYDSLGIGLRFGAASFWVTAQPCTDEKAGT